jgi:hypothetical protein
MIPEAHTRSPEADGLLERRRRTSSELGGSCGPGSDRTQAVQSFALDLAASLFPDAEPLTDLLMGFDASITEPVATNDDLAVTFRQQAQHRRNLAPAFPRDGSL